MNIQAYFSSREQSAEKPTQQPLHASTSAGGQGFQEPKPPRTPERAANQNHHNQHSSHRAQSLGAVLSKRNSDSKRTRVLHPHQHSTQHQSQSNQQQLYQQPMQTQSEQFISGSNVSNSQQPQAENVNYGTGSKREADGWPSPATTHLGMHMQNVHAQSNHFVSPLLPSKQLFQETTNTVIHHNPHIDQPASSYQYRPLLTASHRQGQETAIASASQQQDQQQQQQQPPYQHQINNENNRASSSPMTNKTTKINQQSNTSFDNFGCNASQSQQDQGSTSIGASRSWIYPQHQMTQNHYLAGPLGDHLVDEHQHQFPDDFGPTSTMIGPPDIQDSALSMIDGSNQHEFGGVAAGVPPELPYSSYYSSSYYGHQPPPAPHRYYGYSNRAPPTHHPYDQYAPGPRGYHQSHHHPHPHHPHNMHHIHSSEHQQHAICSSRPAQYYYDSQYGGPTMQQHASQQQAYHNSSGNYYPTSGPNGTSSQAYHQNQKQHHAQRSMGYIDNQQAPSANRYAGPPTSSSAQQYLNEEFMHGNGMMPYPQQHHGPPLPHHNMHPYATASGHHHHMPHYPYGESSSPQQPQHQHQSNHLMIPMNMRSPHHPHHHQQQQQQQQQCPQQYSTLSAHKSASKQQQQSGQKYCSGSSARRRNQSSSQRKQQRQQRHTPNNNNNCNGDDLLPQTHQQVGQGQPYQLEARQLLFDRNADENGHYCPPQADSHHGKQYHEKQQVNNDDVIYAANPADSNQNPQSNSQFDRQDQYSEFETVKIKVNKAQNDQKQQQSAFSRCVPYKSAQQCLTEQHLKEVNHYNQNDEISNAGEQQQLLDSRPPVSDCHHNNDSQLQKHQPSASNKPRQSQGAGATATSIGNSTAGAATRRQDRQSSLLQMSKLLSSQISDAGDNQDDLNFSNAAPDIVAETHHQPQSVDEQSYQKLAPKQPNYDGNFCEPDMKPQSQVQQQCYDHTKHMVQASNKPISGNQNRDAGVMSCVTSSMMDQASSSVYNSTLQSGQTLTNNSKRRSFVYNEENGRYERVIRKRKRKSAYQLNELASYFNNDPHWSKETLLAIALKTGLTEAQVYKWGWDQKRKQFGVEEAERMRKYENILDQQNAKKAANKQLALADIASRKQQTSCYPNIQQYHQNHHQIIELVDESQPQPQQKFSSGRTASCGSRAVARGGTDSGSLDRLGLLNAGDTDNIDQQNHRQPQQMVGQQLRSVQKKRKQHHNNPELTPEHGTASRGQPGCSSPPQDSNDLLASSMTDAIGKMPTKTYMASAEQDYFRSNGNHQHEDGEPDDDRKRVSAFSEIEQQPPRQQMTVKKPSNALKNTESLQKSATTNANTGALHYTPMEKQNKLYDTGVLLQEDNNDSDKFTPEVASRRIQKQQGKDAAKLRKYLPLSNGQECSVSGTPHSSRGQAAVIEPRQTRQRTSIMASSDKSPAAISSSYDTRSQRSSKRLQIRASK